MDHLVTFRTAEGRDGSHTAESLDEALRFVERLRNNEGASDVRLFRMQEIPIEFKPYYKVEVGESRAEEPVPEPAEAVAEAEVALAGSANGEGDGQDPSRRLFNRG